MKDVRMLLDESDFEKIAEVLSSRMRRQFSVDEAKETILGTPPNEFRNVARYLLALKKTTEESINRICDANSPLGATAFVSNLDQAKNQVYNEFIKSLEYDTWETK